MKETLDHCPLCDSQQFEQTLHCQDHFLTKEDFEIQKCSSCKLQFTSPRPDEKYIITYYKSDSYISHNNKSNSPIQYIYKIVRNITIKRKLKMISRFAFMGDLLDYGCGTGHFLSYAAQKGWRAMGVEPDNTARQHLPSNVRESVLPSLADLPQDKRFQVITLFHVLEHVHRLNETILQLLERLDKNGVIFLALPNHESDDASRYGNHWAGYDVPRHLYHFNQRSVFHLSKKYGLNIVSTIPMIFDSYYVSMLSEKYIGRSGATAFLRGLLNGYKSNKSANRTKEYSSLIYVLTK